MTKNKRIDVMVDLETLGTRYDAAIFQIAAASFDIESGVVINDFNAIADLSKLTAEDGVIKGDTLKWWLDTDKELFVELLAASEYTPKEMITSFHDWLSSLASSYEDVCLWGNGIIFDNAIIRHKMEGYGLNYPIHYHNDRDVRTIFELAQHKTGLSRYELRDKIYDKSLKAHDAVNDVTNQIKLVSKCYRILTKGESV